MKRSTTKVIILGFLAFILTMPALNAVAGENRIAVPFKERPSEGQPEAPAERFSNLTYYTVEPCRFLDTRPSQGGFGPIWAGTYVDFYCDFCGVPYPDAKAVMVNICAVDSWGTGHLRAFAYDSPRPFAATLSYGAVPQLGQGICNAAIIPLCGDWGCSYDMSIWTSNTTDIIVDVMGYFQ